MSQVTPVVYFIRHVSTRLNSAGRGSEPERIRGQSDPPPIPEGKAQAQKLARLFSRSPIDEIYTSPLQRALVLAVTIQKGNPSNPKLTPMKELLPWDTGKLTEEDVQKTKSVILKYEIDSPNVSPGSGKGYQGEPYNAFKKRCIDATKGILDEASKGKVCITIWHSRNMDLLEAWRQAGMKSYDVNPEVLRNALSGDQLGTGDGWVYTLKGNKWTAKEVNFADAPERAA